MTDDKLTQYEPGGPVQAAWTWCEQISGPATFEQAWKHATGDPLKHCYALTFVEANRLQPSLLARDHDQLIEDLCASTLDDEHMWRSFCALTSEQLAVWLEPVLSGRRGAASHPRSEGLDTEWVLFAPTQGPSGVSPRDQWVEGQSLLLQHAPGRGWLVIDRQESRLS